MRSSPFLACALLALSGCETTTANLPRTDAAVTADVGTTDAARDVAPADAPPQGLTFRGQPLGTPDRTLRDVDAIGYDLTLALDNATARAETFRAEVSAVFLALGATTQLTLDFEGNDIDDLSVNGARAEYTRMGDQLTITLPTPVADGEGFTVRVRYHGAFRQSAGSSSGFNTNGGLFVVQASGTRSRMFMSLDWPTRTRRWIPVRDHPRDGAMVAMRVTFPEGFTVVSNGRRVSNEPGENGTRVWQYEALTPMPVYDFHVGAYERWSDHETPAAANGVVVHHFDYTTSAANGDRIYADAPAIMDYYTRTFGTYRYGTLAYLQEPAIGGGMEHATVVSMDDSLYADVATTRGVAIHEMAHHWSGNLVRIDTWNDLWLSEGFCDYLSARFVEDHDGDAAARRLWRKYQNNGFRTEHTATPTALLAMRPPLPERGPLEVFSNVVYKKGAWVLRMLELRLGRERFTTFLRGWFDRHAFGHVDTPTFQRELEMAAGESLADFFNAWVYSPMHPVLRVSAAHDATGSTVTVDQVQTAGAAEGFTLSLPVRFSDGTATQNATIALRGRHTEQRVALPFRATGMDVDPDVTVYAALACSDASPCPSGSNCVPFATGSGLSVCLPSN